MQGVGARFGWAIVLAAAPLGFLGVGHLLDVESTVDDAMRLPRDPACHDRVCLLRQTWVWIEEPIFEHGVQHFYPMYERIAELGFVDTCRRLHQGFPSDVYVSILPDAATRTWTVDTFSGLNRLYPENRPVADCIERAFESVVASTLVSPSALNVVRREPAGHRSYVLFAH